MSKTGLIEKLQNGGSVVVAEGYILEFERKGYLKAGSFVPEVVLDHPDLVRQQYEEFVHAGSDVVLALTFYAHREKLKLINREDDLVAMNRSALKMAREVADKHGCLMAGNICNTTAYIEGDAESYVIVENMFKEQIELAVEEGADYIVAETFAHFGEAMLSLECINEYGKGLPAVMTLAAPSGDVMLDGISVVDSCKRLEEAGAAVVGLNCWRGPGTMLPLLKKIKSVCKGPIAALPTPFRTTEEEPTYFSIKTPITGSNAFPLDLVSVHCTRAEIADFAQQCKDMGIQYVGLCCGASANLIRIVAETHGRTPPASKYRPELEKHFILAQLSGTGAHYSDAFRKQFRQHSEKYVLADHYRDGYPDHFRQYSV